MIVATYMTDGGTMVQIDDSYVARRDTDEWQRVIEEQRHAALNVLMAYACRHPKDQKSASHLFAVGGMR